MRKKAMIPLEFVILAIIIFAAAIGIWYAYNSSFKKGTGFLSNFFNSEDDVTDKSFLDLTQLGKKSQALEEKERCAKFRNAIECIGNKEQKTDCFWGKTQEGEGCFSCQRQSYFTSEDKNIVYGKCTAYNTIENDLNDYKLLCETNPCKFRHTKLKISQNDPLDEGDITACIFGNLGDRPDKLPSKPWCH